MRLRAHSSRSRRLVRVRADGTGRPTDAAAAVRQGQPATIEGSSGTSTGPRQRRHRLDRPDTDVYALGGNDRSAWSEGASSQAKVTTRSCRPPRPAPRPSSRPTGGSDTFVGGAGDSDVTIDEISSFHVTMGGTASGPWSCSRPSTPGTGHRRLRHLGRPPLRLRPEAGYGSTWLPRRRASTGSSTSRPIGLHSATATGCKVRMKGDDENNVLNAFGHDIVRQRRRRPRQGGPDRQRLRPRTCRTCGALQVGLPRPGQAPTASIGRLRRRRAHRRTRPRRRERRRRRRHLPRRGPARLRARSSQREAQAPTGVARGRPAGIRRALLELDRPRGPQHPEGEDERGEQPLGDCRRRPTSRRGSAGW